MKDFEWDTIKWQADLEKQGIDFIDVIAIFFNDDTRLERACVKNNEKRYQTIGIVNGIVFYSVHPKRK